MTFTFPGSGPETSLCDAPICDEGYFKKTAIRKKVEVAPSDKLVPPAQSVGQIPVGLS